MPDHRPEDDGAPYSPTPADELRRVRYTLFPVLYTDEDSTVNDLLWQLVLEQRGARYLAAIACGLLLALVVLVVVLVAVIA